MKNSDCGRKGIPLNLNENKLGEVVHTNPNGKVVKVKQIGEEYFSKRKKGHKDFVRGCSWMFPNHLEYNGWLSMNNFCEVEVEELDEKWS